MVATILSKADLTSTKVDASEFTHTRLWNPRKKYTQAHSLGFRAECSILSKTISPHSHGCLLVCENHIINCSTCILDDEIQEGLDHYSLNFGILNFVLCTFQSTSFSINS